MNAVAGSILLGAAVVIGIVSLYHFHQSRSMLAMARKSESEMRVVAWFALVIAVAFAAIGLTLIIPPKQ